jgi:hypothetical protein
MGAIPVTMHVCMLRYKSIYYCKFKRAITFFINFTKLTAVSGCSWRSVGRGEIKITLLTKGYFS